MRSQEVGVLKIYHSRDVVYTPTCDDEGGSREHNNEPANYIEMLIQPRMAEKKQKKKKE